MRKSRNHSFEKKLAAAVSVVNLLNAAAPIALPYVTMTRDMGAAGATTESLSNVAARALYGTAHAETTVVHSGEHLSVDVLSAGDTQIIESGGYGEVFPEEHFGPPPFTGGKNFGTQSVGNGGTGVIYTNSGTQIVESGGSASINMNYGTQTLLPGANGDAGSIYNNASQTIASGAKGKCDAIWGSQIVSSGGTGRSTNLIYFGGTQSVLEGGTGYVNVIAGGRQVISSGGMGSAAEVTSENGGTPRHGYQYIYGGTGIADRIPYGGHQEVSGGMGIINLVSGGGDQEVMSGGTGVITTLDGGNQTIYSMGGMAASGTVETMKGGTQIVWPDCAGLVKVMSGGTQDLQKGGTGVVTTMRGGKQIVSSSAKGTVKTLSGGTQIIQNGGTGSVSTMAGGTIALSPGGKVSGLLIGYGTISGALNQSDAELVVAGGTLSTNAMNVKNITIADGSWMEVSGDLTAERVSIAVDVTKYKTSAAPITANGDKVKIGVVDFTEATATSINDGDYHIIQGSLSTSIDDLQVSMNGQTATLKAGGSSVLIRSEKTTAMPKPNLTVGFETKQTIELNQYKQQSNMLFYKIRNTLTDATFNGAIPWNPNEAYLDFSAADSKFAPTFSVYVADLGFSFGDGWASELKPGQSYMELLTGLPEYASLGGANPSPMPITSSGANTDLSGSVKGTPSINNGTVKFTVDEIRLDSVSVKAVTANTDVVPKRWTPGLSGIQVDTDNLIVAPDDVPDSETTLLRGNNSFFRDRNITGRYKYAAKASFNHEKNGVTLDGTWSRGVRAANDGMSLVFVNSELTANSVTLGKMAWGTPRALPANLNCNFRRATIDATNLMFTNLDTGLAPRSATYLLTGADNLAAKASITGAAHRQDFSATAGNGVSFGATLAGTVSTDGDSVKYTANSVTLNEAVLAGWNGTAGEVPEGWTKNSAGVTVNTDNMNLHPEDLVNQTTNILTGSAGFFSDASLSGANIYKTNADFASTRNGVTLSGSWSRGVRAANDGMSLVFVNRELTANNVTLGKMAWGTPRALPENLDCDFKKATIDATNLMFTNLDTGLAPGATYLLTGADNLAAKASITGAAHRQDFSATAGNGVSFGATLVGTVSTDGDSVKYTANSVTLNDVALAGWNGTVSEVPESWMKNSAGIAVDTDVMSLHPEELASRNSDILTGSAGFFSAESLHGSNVYKENSDFSSTRKNVTLSGNWSRGVVVENGGKDLVFRAGDVFVDKIALGTIPWQAGGSLRPNAWLDAIHYDMVDAVDTRNFSIENPADAAPGESVTLLTANLTLKDMATEAKAAYRYSPVSGVTVTGGLTGDLKAAGGNLTFTALSNEASNLSFQGVNWTRETALMARPQNISFNGATVDTSKIIFTNKPIIKKGDVMTLVSNYDGEPSAIVGDKYRIGTAFEGDGHAFVSSNDLIFTVESAPDAAEQTHNALMGAGAGMVTLSAGNDAIGNATGGLGQASNIGSDGVSTYAQMGGGSTRQETGSHIDVHSWNAILALGRKNEKEKSTFEYGAFFEYGTGNYTTHNGDLRGDGSMRYTGGGLLAKWTAKHGLYVEGSLRAGSIHGETNGVLRDAGDNPYSYENDAPYWGLHLGIGKEIELTNGNTLDIYGKYFMNRRNGVDFTAGEGNYDLDALTSHILRVGARYAMKRDKWSYYGGLAYEHELDGKASGTVSNGVLSVPIRGTDPTGGSLRMEVGATMKPDKNSPWSLDLNVAGFAGKKQGFSGGVSVAFMF